MTDERFAPPAHLSERAQGIWAEVVPRHARTAGRLALLQAALEALDLCDKAREELGDGKLTSKTLATGTLHQSPAFKTLREARQQFAQLWNQLGLNHYGPDAHSYEHWAKNHSYMEPRA